MTSKLDLTTDNTALLIIDVQNDFMPGGALEVSQGDQIVPIINDIQRYFDLVIATQDWHPTNHSSFGNAVRLEGIESSPSLPSSPSPSSSPS